MFEGDIDDLEVQREDLGIDDDTNLKAFLELFDREHWASIESLFMFQVNKKQYYAPETVYDGVLDDVDDTLDSRRPDDIGRRFYTQLSICLSNNRKMALWYAKWVVDFCSLPPTQQAKVRNDRSLYVKKDAMVGQPPTERQLRFLRSLGYDGDEPEDRLKASQLIEEYKNG